MLADEVTARDHVSADTVGDLLRAEAGHNTSHRLGVQAGNPRARIAAPRLAGYVGLG